MITLPSEDRDLLLVYNGSSFESLLTRNTLSVLPPLNVRYGVAPRCTVEGGDSVCTYLQVARPDRDLGRICIQKKK